VRVNEPTTLAAALRANPYPGRLLVLARTPAGELLGGYALTGRGESSRARRLRPAPDGAALHVVPTTEREHDALRHYPAALADERWTVWGNGEQVARVAARLAAGQPPAAALDDLAYEPDPPIHTPRITAVVDRRTGRAWLGAARRASAPARREAADVTVTAFGALAPGDCVLLGTYRSDGVTVATSPRHLDLRTGAAGPDELLAELWEALPGRYAVAATAFAPLDGVGGPLRHA
jgi:IMP cyclohydrolase